jgi:integrase
VFKAFWHWWMKVNRKEGKLLIDICEDIELKKPAINFVYLTKEQIDLILPYFTEDEQILILFLFDTIIRFPTECLSLRVKDLYEKNNEVWVNIPDNVSKTFGRTFNLLYCGKALQKYIERKKLSSDDYIFNLDVNKVGYFNKKLKTVAVQVLGDKISHPKAQGKFSELSGYDFRHSGAIHLRILAQKSSNISLDAIRQRGGWSDFEMLNYYTQLIGLSGHINKEDILVEEDKSKMEKKISEQDKTIQQLQNQMDELIDTLINKKKITIEMSSVKKLRDAVRD